MSDPRIRISESCVTEQTATPMFEPFSADFGHGRRRYSPAINFLGASSGRMVMVALDHAMLPNIGLTYLMTPTEAREVAAGLLRSADAADGKSGKQ